MIVARGSYSTISNPIWIDDCGREELEVFRTRRWALYLAVMSIAMAAVSFPAHHANSMLGGLKEGTPKTRTVPEAESKMKQMLQ